MSITRPFVPHRLRRTRVAPIARARAAVMRAAIMHAVAAMFAVATIGVAPLAAQPALAGAARWADSARRVIEEGVVTGEVARLRAGGAVASRALQAWPGDALLLHYAGYAAYREAMMRPDDDSTAEALLATAAEQFERSLAARALPETQALLGAAYGALAGRGMMAGMRFGPRAARASEAAAQAGPRNPRVLLLAATGAWFTPSMWGGGKDKARALLARAIAAFEGDAPAPPLPAWGRAEAYAWLGQFERDAGRTDAARAAYDRALALEPRYAWVRDVLRPAVAER
jgi:tetratricopeptide (TPR) repeat protein